MQYLRRIEATLATKNEFIGRSLDYKAVDCLRIAAFCLRQLGHSKPTKGVRKYSSLLGAVRALKESGFKNLIEAVDDYGLTPIPPALAIAGDIIAYPGVDFGGFSLGVAIGDNKFLGIAPDSVVQTAEIWAASHAWRSV